MLNFLSAGDFDGRTVAISDIHGNLSLLERLLEKVGLSENDRLVFVGDYINRGPSSVGVLRRLMEIAKRPETYILKGNIERLGKWYFETGCPEDILPHFEDHKNNLFVELARELGFEKVGFDNFYRVREAICRAFPDIISFIAELPLALDTPDVLFVHSGIDGARPWRESTEQQMLKNDAYLESGVNNTGKWLSVGHMPTWNVSRGTTNNILIDERRRIIGIDGGNCVKSFAQINALIIEKKDGRLVFSQVFADGYDVVFAAESFSPLSQNDFLKNVWPHSRARLIEKGEYFSRVELAGTGQTGMVKNEHIAPDGDACRFLKSTTPLFLQVEKGERLYLLDGSCAGYAFVKNGRGECGWVPNAVVGI